MIFFSPAFSRSLYHLHCTVHLAPPDLLLVGFVFWRIRYNDCLIHISGHKRNFFVVDRMKYFRVCFVQSPQIDHLIGARNPELSRIQGDFTFFPFHLFQRIRDYIGTISKAVEETILYTAQTGIRTEDEFAAIEIFDHLCL